MTEMISFIFTK